jgi:septum formation protein
MSFILASSSPRRRELLAKAAPGLTYTIVKPDVDESQRPDEPPLHYVQRLAREKAEAVAAQLVEGSILAADTVVILAADTIGIDEKGEILGKPAASDEAREMLQRLRDRAHVVCTAFCLLRKSHDRTDKRANVVKTVVTMRAYTDAEIEAYIATGDPFDKAGAYAIQHEGFHPVALIQGSYSNVVGLPVDEVRAALIEMGIIRDHAQ